MTPVLEPPAIRRIVVTLDNSESAQSVLDVAVRLAAVLGAELEGVFVEDINLIRLSGLPFLREIRVWSLAEEGISTQSMQRDLRALARQAERVFLEAAQAMGVGCTFRVWRGHASVETLSASFEADIISLRGGPTLLYHARPLMNTRSPAASINVLFSASPAGRQVSFDWAQAASRHWHARYAPAVTTPCGLPTPRTRCCARRASTTAWKHSPAPCCSCAEPRLCRSEGSQSGGKFLLGHRKCKGAIETVHRQQAFELVRVFLLVEHDDPGVGQAFDHRHHRLQGTGAVAKIRLVLARRR